MKVCNTEGCSYPVFSKGKCRFHMEKKPLRKSSQLVFNKKRKAPSGMREFFLSIWSKRPHYSEVSGKFLGHEPLSTMFHHILEKELYPELALDEDCVILVTPEEHQIVHIYKYKYEEINRRRKELLKKIV